MGSNRQVEVGRNGSDGGVTEGVILLRFRTLLHIMKISPPNFLVNRILSTVRLSAIRELKAFQALPVYHVLRTKSQIGQTKNRPKIALKDPMTNIIATNFV